MSNKIKNIVVTATFIAFMAFFAVMCTVAYFNPVKTSESERRPLAQFPEEITWEGIIDKSAIEDFEDYTVDQFPMREFFRSLKAKFHLKVLGLKENNGMTELDGYIAKIEPEFTDATVDYSTGRLEYIFEKYLKDNGGNKFVTIVPDKNYFYSDLSYGLLPMPKLDASEEGYYGAGYDRPLVVPITAEDRLDTIGLVVEALNAEGYKQVFPAYYELAMKSRYADQTDDAKMIDIMHDNIIISFTFIHDNYGSVYGKMLWDLFNKSNPSKDVASWCAKNEKSQSNRVEFLKEFFAERNS